MKDQQTPVVTFEKCLLYALSGQRECLHHPETEVELGVVALGELTNPVARAVYSLREELKSSMKRFDASIPEDQTTLSPADLKKFKLEAHSLQNRFAVAEALFWELVYTEYPVSRDETVAVGIRKDWKVVIFKKEPHQFNMGIPIHAIFSKMSKPDASAD